MVAPLIIIPIWMKDRLAEEVIQENCGPCPLCGSPASLARVRITRKKMLYSVVPVSSKDLGEFMICRNCGERFRY